MSLTTPMRAMILAAGYGTRLFPLTIDRAKPALPFMNRPLVGYVAEYLSRYGCREVAVNLHHESESIRHALGDGMRFGVEFRYFEEPEILGTSGALVNAREFLDGGTFVAINGKIVTNINLDAALETHRRTNALATLILQRNPRRERFSIVNMTPDNLITSFGGMPAFPSDNEGGLVDAENDNDAPLMFTGIQILEPEIFSYIPPHGFSHTTTDVYPRAIRNGERVVAHIAEGAWYEMSTIERYLDISIALMRDENLAYVCGEDCVIGEGARVGDSVIWRNVKIEDEARIEACVIGDDVRIAAGREFRRAAIVRGDLVRGVTMPPKALAGEFVGDNFVVPLPG